MARFPGATSAGVSRTTAHCQRVLSSAISLSVSPRRAARALHTPPAQYAERERVDANLSTHARHARARRVSLSMCVCVCIYGFILYADGRGLQGCCGDARICETFLIVDTGWSVGWVLVHMDFFFLRLFVTVREIFVGLFLTGVIFFVYFLKARISGLVEF